MTLFAAFAARHTEGLAVYGPFATRSDARLCADWLGSTDPDVFATRAIAIYPPYCDPLTTETPRAGGEVVELPDTVASLVATHNAEAAVDDASAVVALIVLDTPRHPALVVGPFDSHAAHQWLDRANTPGGGRAVDYYLLPLRPNDLGIDTSSSMTMHPTNPAVILLDTEDGSVAYGPFGSGLDAALYWRDVTDVLDLTNVRRTHVCDLTPPTAHAVAATDSVRNLADERVRGWVVRLASTGHDQEPRLVGPFADEHNAQTWRPESTTTAAPAATVLPIYAP